MDYLLRDSHHAGVTYGHFDHYRLVDTLRILPPPPSGAGGQSDELQLGVEHGGIHTAEALGLARYFMYSQLYFHPVRRIYNIHLVDFLREWLPDGKFETLPARHLCLMDDKISSAISDAARDHTARGHDAARRIAQRRHFRLAYEQNPDDTRLNDKPAAAVYHALCREFDPHSLRLDTATPKPGSLDFPVRLHDGRIVSSLAISGIIRALPAAGVDLVFAAPDIAPAAREFVQKHRTSIMGGT